MRPTMNSATPSPYGGRYIFINLFICSSQWGAWFMRNKREKERERERKREREREKKNTYPTIGLPFPHLPHPPRPDTKNQSTLPQVTPILFPCWQTQQAANIPRMQPTFFFHLLWYTHLPYSLGNITVWCLITIARVSANFYRNLCRVSCPC